jgi:hypothetical protein
MAQGRGRPGPQPGAAGVRPERRGRLRRSSGQLGSVGAHAPRRRGAPQHLRALAARLSQAAVPPGLPRRHGRAGRPPHAPVHRSLAVGSRSARGPGRVGRAGRRPRHHAAPLLPRRGPRPRDAPPPRRARRDADRVRGQGRSPLAARGPHAPGRARHCASGPAVDAAGGRAAPGAPGRPALRPADRGASDPRGQQGLVGRADPRVPDRSTRAAPGAPGRDPPLRPHRRRQPVAGLSPVAERRVSRPRRGVDPGLRAARPARRDGDVSSRRRQVGARDPAAGPPRALPGARGAAPRVGRRGPGLGRRRRRDPEVLEVGVRPARWPARDRRTQGRRPGDAHRRGLPACGAGGRRPGPAPRRHRLPPPRGRLRRALALPREPGGASAPRGEARDQARGQARRQARGQARPSRRDLGRQRR